MTACVQITTTIGSRAAADDLAVALVEARLAACAQVSGPVASVYRWHGAVERAEEWHCQLKTTRACQPALEAELRALHPYEVPEIIAVPLEGSPSYLEWIEQSVRKA